MAMRRIDFTNINIPDSTSIRDAIPNRNADKAIVTNSNGTMEVVPKENFGRTMDNVIDIVPIQTDLEDGMSVTESYFHKEIPYMKEYFFKDFRVNPEVYFDDSGWIRIKNFPLPNEAYVNGVKYTYRNDFEDIIIILDNYPEMPPIGFHIREDSPNKSIFETLFNTHLFNQIVIGSESYQRDVKELSNHGWYWVCFHYKNNKWDFNRNNIKQGDSLFRYFHYLFAKFNGLDVAQ